MEGQEINKNQNSPIDTPNTSLDQSPGLTQQDEALDNKDKALAIKRIKAYGIIGLIFGIVILILNLLPYTIPQTNDSGEPTGILILWLYYPIFMVIKYGGAIVCAAFLVLALVDMKKYKIKFSWYIVMIIIGFLLIFSPDIYSRIQAAIIASDPFRTTTVNTNFGYCHSSTNRANNKNWSDVNSLGGEPEFIAEDIACSYLEYFYDNNEEPSSNTQFQQYYQSYNAKNGIAVATINAEQPRKPNIYNIITHRSCAYDDKDNNSAISVWFRVEKEHNGMGCISVSANKDLYDLEQSKEWYDEQFKVEITRDEVREIIENEQKASNNDTWTIGAIKKIRKSRKDDYYWIEYEKIKSDNSITEANALLHRENGTWIFESSAPDNEFNKRYWKDV